MIKQSVLNTMQRVGLDATLDNTSKNTEVENWITGERITTTKLLAECVLWVYRTSLAYERGDFSVKTDDFDRIRYFILGEDSQVYMTCID